MYNRWFRIFQTSRYQGIVKATVFGVFEDLKFKISEGSDQNWSCPESALLPVSVQFTSILVRAFWNFKCKILKYSRTCSLHNTLIPNLVKPLMFMELFFDSLRLVIILAQSEDSIEFYFMLMNINHVVLIRKYA